MKKRARETEETPQQIISNAVAHLNEHAAVTMPPVHHIRNFWRFIDILKREQNLTQVNIAQARAGHPAEPQRRRYQDSNQRIKNIVQDYPNRNIMQYLRGLAHNISM